MCKKCEWDVMGSGGPTAKRNMFIHRTCDRQGWVMEHSVISTIFYEDNKLNGCILSCSLVYYRISVRAITTMHNFVSPRDLTSCHDVHIISCHIHIHIYIYSSLVYVGLYLPFYCNEWMAIAVYYLSSIVGCFKQTQCGVFILNI